MSNTIQCDTCGATLPTQSEPLMDWMRVEWGVGRMNVGQSDFCSLDCLTKGAKKEVSEREAFRAQIEADGRV